MLDYCITNIIYYRIEHSRSNCIIKLKETDINYQILSAMFFTFNNPSGFPFAFQEQNSAVPNPFAQFFGYPQQPQQNQRQRPNQRNSQREQPNPSQNQFEPSETSQPQPPQQFSQPQASAPKTNAKKEQTQKVKQIKLLDESHALFWKNKGNQLYKEQKYDEAVQMYTRGISINDSHSSLFVNRAKSYKMVGRLEEALADIQMSIDLEDVNIKAYLIQGQLLAQLSKKQDSNDKLQLAIQKINKALRLCTTLKRPQYRQDITIYLKRAKKLLWYKQYTKLQQAKRKKINDYKNMISRIDNISQEEINNLVCQYAQSFPTQSFQIPDGYLCKITYDLIEDPVTTEFGHTYERSAIEQHMKQNGRYDPFSRKAISTALYPNILVKSLIDEFLEKNPWAFEYIQGEDCNKIKF